MLNREEIKNLGRSLRKTSMNLGITIDSGTIKTKGKGVFKKKESQTKTKKVK